MRALAFVPLALVACGEVTADSNANPAPTISALSPDHGPIAGGVVVTLRGSGLADHAAGDDHVIVGGREATAVDPVDDSSLTFMLPPGLTPDTAVDVVVFNQNGVATAAAALRYNPLPTLAAIAPAHGKLAGGSTVTLTGTGFKDLEAGAATITIGGAITTSVQVVDDTTLTAVLASGGAAPTYVPTDVEVANANGKATLAGGFRYTRPGLLAVSNRNSTTRGVWFIDPATAETTLITRTEETLGGISAASDGTLLAVTSCCPSNLVVIDPFVGVTEVRGAMRTADQTQRKTQRITLSGTTLFSYDPTNQTLWQVDPATAIVTQVATAIGTSQTSGIARRDASTLWVANHLNQPIRFVNTTTGAVSTGSTLVGLDQEVVHGLAQIGTQLFATIRNLNTNTFRLVKINALTGAVTDVGPVPQGINGITPTPPTF